MITLIPSIVNFILLVGLLFYYLRKPVKGMVHDRHHHLRTELERVRDQLQTAQQKFQEHSAKLQAMDLEVQQLAAQTRTEVEASKVRLVTEAKRLADTIVIDAKRSSETMVADMKTQIRGELAAQVIERAESLIRAKLTGDDRARIQKDFSKQVEKSQ